MKASRALVLAAATLLVGFFAARWCVAQSALQPESKEIRYDFGAMRELESFVLYLQETNQTNTLQRFGTFLNASLTLHSYRDISSTLAILQRLRDGRTNAALELLELRLSGDIIGFVATYRELPASNRKQARLKILENTRDYRARFPFQHSSTNVNQGVAEAFKILDERTK